MIPWKLEQLLAGLKVGDTVTEGDILAEIETDKATMEFEAFYGGTLLHIGIQEGESAKVDSLLAIIGDKDADVEQALAYANASNASAVEVKEEAPKAAPAPTPATPAPAPVAAAVAAPTPVQNTSGRVIASPLAKRLAEERGIQLAQVQGSGDGGRIIKRDIEHFKGGNGGSAAPQGIESVVELANNQMRKTIAKRLGVSRLLRHTITLRRIRHGKCMAFRQQYNSMPDTKILQRHVVKATAKGSASRSEFPLV